MRKWIFRITRLLIIAMIIGGLAYAAAKTVGRPDQVAETERATRVFHKALILEAGAGNHKAAIEAYRKFISEFSTSDYCPRAQYRIGLCFKLLGKYKDAARAFELVEKRYPEKTDFINRARREKEAVSLLIITSEQRTHLDTLAKEAGTADATRKENIAHELSHMKIEAVLPILYAMLNDSDVKVRLAALSAIADIGSRKALPELQKHLNDPISPKFRFEVKRTVARLELLTPPEIMDMLYGKNSERRELARASLSEYKKSPLVDMLVLRLGESARSDGDRSLTLIYLGLTGDRRKRPVCAEYMKPGQSALVHLSAACAVAMLGGKKDAVPVLKNGLESDDDLLQSLSANYLAMLSLDDGCAVLIRDLQSEDLTRRKKAVQSLRSLSGKTFGFDPVAPEDARNAAAGKWAEWWKRKTEK
jgi:tetratricopeptide (TPR) repeat protein